MTTIPITTGTGIEAFVFLMGMMLVTFVGIVSAYGGTLIWGALFGGLIGWLYDRTHPASDNQNASPKTDPTSAT